MKFPHRRIVMVGGWKSIPLDCVDVSQIDRDLTVTYRPLGTNLKDRIDQSFTEYHLDGDRILVPRYYTPHYKYPIEEVLTPSQYEQVNHNESGKLIALRENQKRPYEVFAKAKNGILSLGCGRGKCIDLDESYILTKSGYRRFRNIVDEQLGFDSKKIGLEVGKTYEGFQIELPTGDGKAKLAEGFYYLGKKKGLRIHLDTGTSINVHPNHRISSNRHWKFAENLKLGDPIDLGPRSIFPFEDTKSYSYSNLAGLLLCWGLFQKRKFEYINHKTLGVHWTVCSPENFIREGNWKKEGINPDHLLIPDKYLQGNFTEIAELFHILILKSIEKKSDEVEVQLQNKQLCLQVCFLGSILGIPTKYISRKSKHFVSIILGDLSSYILDGLKISKFRIMSKLWAYYKNRTRIGNIVKIEQVKGDYGDIHVPSDHTYYANDIKCHNSVLAIHKMRQTATGPVCVVVDNEGLLSQWANFALEHGIVKSQADIGYIWQQVLKIKPFTVGMLKTIALRSESKPDWANYFQQVYFDEAHKAASYKLMRDSLSMFSADRYALTATPKRADGLGRLLELHVGPMIYQDVSTSIMPKVYVVDTGARLSEPWRKSDQLLLSMFCNVMPEPTNAVIHIVMESLKYGRNVLILSPRLEQIQNLYERIPTPNKSFIDGSIKGSERVRRYSNQVVIAQRSITDTGLDRVSKEEYGDFDTLISTIPMASTKSLQQSIGRILREFDEKRAPKVYIMTSSRIPLLTELTGRMTQCLMSLRYPFEHIAL